MKRIIYTFISTVIIIGQLRATEQPKSPQVIPASPEASALGKYGAFPVGYYTGVPSINIPLYELKAGEISLPISLSYHASGIRVDDIASSVGLGWSLNAGGCISVEVRGKPDMVPAEYYNGQLTNYPYPRFPGISFRRYLNRSEKIYSAIPFSVISSIAGGETAYDMEPDVYNYNLGGSSGQFIIADNKQIKFLKNNDGTKALFDATNCTFTLINKKGEKYIFKDKETTSTLSWNWGLNSDYQFMCGSYISSSGSTSYSAWYLSEIIGENCLDTIKFVYESGIEKYTTRKQGHLSSFVMKQVIVNDGTTYVSGPYCRKSFQNQNSWILPPDAGADFSNSTIQHTVLRLKEIQHKKSLTTVRFNTSNRDDLYGGKKIDKITVLYQNDSIESWNLNYGYFATSWQQNEIDQSFPTTVLSTLNKRLKLASIQKKGRISSTSENPYEFTYYADNANSKLPYRNCTNGFDHWGYFNAELNTVDEVNNALHSFPAITASSPVPITTQVGIFIPYGTPTGGETSVTPPENFSIHMDYLSLNSYSIPNLPSGGNRNPNEVYSKSLSLKDIIYPTGGKTTFDYENNAYTSLWNSTQAGMAGGIRIKRMVDKTETDSIVKEYTYSGGVIYSLPNYISAFYHIMFNDRRYFYFNNFSDASPYSYGDKIGYPQVYETCIDSKNNQQFKTFYQYYSPKDYDAGCYEQVGFIENIGADAYNQSDNLYKNSVTDRMIVRPFDVPILGKSYKYGLLKSVGQYKGNTLIKEESFFYDNIVGDSIFGNRIKFYDEWLISIDCEYNNNLGESYSTYFFDIYFHETGKNFLKRKTEKVYDQNGLNPVVKSTLYEYNINNELIKTITDSLGYATIRNEITYPFDYQNYPYYQGSPHPFQTMTSRNMIDYPVANKKFVNDKLTNLDLKLYLSNSGIVNISNVYTLSMINPLNNLVEITQGDALNLYNVNSALNKEADYSYYSNGKVKEIIDTKSGITTTYIWGYENQYPIAKIEGANYNAVSYAMSGTNINDLSRAATPDMSKISILRTSPYVNFAKITTYTYKPLVGMTSKTDPRGVTTYYQYDPFNRLKYIKDNKGKILQQFDYNYQH